MKLQPIAILALSLVAGSAQGTSIGVFTAPDASDCDATVVPFVPFFTYHMAILGGDAAATGITGAQFQVLGYDPTWTNIVTPSPAASLQIGSPISGGCNIAFPACVSGSAVLLYTVQSVAFAPVTPRSLTVTGHCCQVNDGFLCPLVTLCDAVFTKLCVTGGQAFLNRSDATCAVGVERTSWSQIKELFDS